MKEEEARIRIEKAQELLRTGNYSISEVIELSGFNNASTFLKWYKYFCGHLPREDKPKRVRSNRKRVVKKTEKATQIEKAQELLKTGKYQVKEVATLVGFNTPPNFRYWFKKITGTLPIKFKPGLWNTPLTLDQARNRFEKNRTQHPRGIKISFDELFNLFKVDCNDFVAIAKSAKISPTRVRTLYHSYFQWFFPKSRATGRVRRKICTRKRKSIEVKKLKEEQLSDPGISSLNQEIKKLGLNVDVIVKKRNNGTPGKSVKYIINSRICSIHQSKVLWRQKRSQNLFSRFCLTPRRVDESKLIIFVQQSEQSSGRFFIIPSRVIQEKCTPTAEGIYNLYIPVEKTEVYNNPPRINFWEYENAWHLLKES